jgi:hypothetical protein
MLSLPIPDLADGKVHYSDLSCRSGTLLDLLHQLGYSRYGRHAVAHLDPDLVAARYPRLPGWRPLFGQVGASATHLLAQGVGPGDLFIFWGLFRHAIEQNGRLRFEGRPFHAIFGYLEVDSILDAGSGENAAFAPEFPHFRDCYRGKTCRVYLAPTHLTGSSRPGSGVFRYNDGLRLTTPGTKRLTDWRLPACFHPQNGVSLSYHAAANRWGVPAHGLTRLRAVSRGQEFVAAPNAGVAAWARGLIATTEPANEPTVPGR